jgi:gliding motility-associated-like protein
MLNAITLMKLKNIKRKAGTNNCFSNKQKACKWLFAAIFILFSLFHHADVKAQLPTATIISNDTTFCESGMIKLRIQFTGTYPFGLVYTLYDENGAWFEVKKIINSNEAITNTDTRLIADKTIQFDLPTSDTKSKYYIKINEVFDGTISFVQNTNYWGEGTGSKAVSGQMNIQVDKKPNPMVTVLPDTCGYYATLQGKPDDVSTTYHWEATQGSFSNANIAKPEFTAPTAGTYNLNFIQTNGSCTTTVPTQVTLKGAPSSNISGNQTICSTDGTNYMMDVAVELTGNAPFNYTISDGAASSYSATGQYNTSFNQSVTATYNNQTYTITSLIDNNGCDADLTAKTGQAVVTDKKPNITLTTSSPVCGPTTTLQGNADKGSGIWTTTGGATISSPNNPSTNVQTNQYGNQTFTWLVDNNGCTNSAQANIKFIKLPELTIVSPETTICEGSVTELQLAMTGNSPWKISYNNGANQSVTLNNPTENITLNPSVSTIYNFYKIEDVHGCATDYDVDWTLTVEQKQQANAGDDITIERDYTTILTALNSDVTGKWEIITGTSVIDGTDTNPQASVKELVVGENRFKWTIIPVTCPSSSDEVSVFVKNYTTYNGFSPNNDGINDLFFIDGAKSGEENELSVFNRQGKLVYSQKNYQNNWNGTDMNGSALEDDTYYFIFTSTNHSPVKDYVVIRRSNTN